MRYLHSLLLSIVTLTFGTTSLTEASEPKAFELPLWETSAPGALGTEEKDIPKAIVRLPASDSPTGALVICPGGGYGGLAMDHEGYQFAAWANEMGMAAIICDYRHRGKGYGHPAPSDDAKRAVRLTRAKSKEWNIDSTRVGLIGFSAGGHLVSTVLTQYDEGEIDKKDVVNSFSARPDFGILCYPVILFGHRESHKGSEVNLLGEAPDANLVASLANHSRVTAAMPPTFLMHTLEDTVVPVANSLEFYSAMVKHDVPGELHVYEYGRHGIGLAHDIPDASEWPEACKRWLRTRKIIE